MKNNYIIFLILYIIPISTFSQQETLCPHKNQIGIQLNPYVDERFFVLSNFYTVSSLRYNYHITKNISTGIEFSYIFPIANSTGIQRSSYLKLGVISRFSTRPTKRIQLFAEVSPYYLNIRSKTLPPPGEKIHANRYAIYFAPGVSVYTKNRRFSFDLYYKFMNHRYFYGKNSVLSYKFNFNF